MKRHKIILFIMLCALVSIVCPAYSLESSSNGGTSVSIINTDLINTMAKVSTLRLSIFKGGNGTGSVTADSGTIDWNAATGVVSYSTGTVVNLTSTADSNSTFVGWSGACSGTGTCQVAMTESKAVTAKFIFAPLYTLSSVPPVIALPGNPVAFRVYSSKLGSSATLSFAVDGSPKGDITFNASTGLFRYIPDPADNRTFRVTFTATLGLAVDPQTVEITPVPSLPPEQSVFGLTPTRPFPDPEGKEYWVQSYVGSKDAEPFNNDDIRTRSVTVSGNTVVFKKGHFSGLFEAYSRIGDSGARDIKQMEIYADRLIIGSHVRLPQTNVTIYARVLEFEDGPDGDKAAIDTTPLSLGDMAPCRKKDKECVREDGLNGADGLTAGTITLHVQSALSKGFAKRLIAHGGNGQIGGNSSQGNKGKGRPICGNGKVTWTEPYTRCTDSFCLQVSGCGSSDWKPDNGSKQPIPPGKPGEGGNGGWILANFELSPDYVDIEGGLPGKKAQDAPGGEGGDPRPAQHKRDGVLYEEHWSQQGPTNYAPGPVSIIGPLGTVALSGNALSGDWLSPYSVKMVLIYAKDLYLYRYVDKAAEVLQKYRDAIAAYKTTPEWTVAEPTWQSELSQMQAEMETILHRIASNLDYFGNPAGWAPMLSFEVNKLAYEAEVDRAIRLWYLTYWISNKSLKDAQAVSAMEYGRDKIYEDIKGLKIEYQEAMEMIPKLNTAIADIAIDTETLKTALLNLETRLAKRAQDNVEERHRVPFWKQSLGVLGGIAQICPIGQPTVGIVGLGLSTISEFNPDDPLALIKKTPKLNFEQFQSYENHLTDLRTNLASIPDNLDAANIKDIAKDVQKILGPVADQITKYKLLLEQQQAPKSEVDQELDKLKASDPMFINMTKRVKELADQKEEFIRKLNKSSDTLASSAAGIERDLLAIDSLNESIQAGKAAQDKRAVAYLKEMEKNSKERLLKYHYHMAKAYEYRLVKAYRADLNTQNIFDRIVTIAEAKVKATPDALDNHVLQMTEEEYLSLRPLFEIQISQIASDILTWYNSNATARPRTITLTLTPADLQLLNTPNLQAPGEGLPLLLNLQERGRFNPDEENIRIADINIFWDTLASKYGIATHPVNGKLGSSWADVTIDIEHSGLSKLTKDGETYLFRHYSNATQNPLKWSLTYDALNNSYYQLPLMSSTDSLINSLIGNQTKNLLIYSRPSGLADLIIKRKVNTDNDVDIALDKLILQITYEYTPKSAMNLVQLHVAALDSNLNTRLLPHFYFNTVDNNKRQDGVGDIYRTFTRNRTVTVEAPTTHGAWKFSHWTNFDGSSNTFPKIEVSLTSDKKIKANYVLPTSKLTVTSNQAEGLTISVDQKDLGENSDGTTSFIRTYAQGTTVTLTAPLTVGSTSFSGWSGCTRTGGANGETCIVTMGTDGTDITVAATYVTPTAKQN